MIDIRFLLLAMMGMIAIPVRGEDAPVADSLPTIAEEEIVVPADDDTVRIFVIPIQGQIGKPALYVVRRGVKEAIEAEAKVIVLDMNTPGGDLGTTLEIMQILDRYEGLSVTYVNSDAISAGAFISAATDEIRFAPDGVIGAAAPVMATGGEIDETMQLKIESYLKAKIRSISEDYPMRADVISAMVDADHELKIGDEILKPKGELLSLTATEAITLTSESGVVTSIAHPLTIDPGDSSLRSIFEDLLTVGLAGIEAYYSEHPPHIRAQLASVAAELGLVATGGSDYHGTGKPGLEIGTGRGDLVVPDTALEELRARKP